MRIAAIDFETANAARSSACSVGIVVFENGQITKEYVEYIRPRPVYFDPRNIRIHGITDQDVLYSDEFPRVWQSMQPLLEGALVIAHNASFDMSVLRHCFDQNEIPYPEFSYACTLHMARKAWPELDKHGLGPMAEFLGIKFRHHDALEDARVCVEIVKRVLGQTSARTPVELSTRLGIGIGKIFPGGYVAPRNRRRARAGNG